MGAIRVSREVETWEGRHVYLEGDTAWRGPAQPRASKPPETNESILVVDDDEMVRTAYKSILEVLGYGVDTVATGEEAVDYLRDHPVDLLLLDLTLPGIDGRETYRRALQCRPGQRAIVVSGLSMGWGVADLLEMGASAYVSKSSGFDSLIRAVEMGLRSRVR